MAEHDEQRRLKMKQYPECEKLQGLEAEHRTIVEFHDYLMSQGLVICQYVEDDLVHTSKSAQTLIFDMYGIDPIKLEDERRQILEDVRKTNAPKI